MIWIWGRMLKLVFLGMGFEVWWQGDAGVGGMLATIITGVIWRLVM